MLLPINLAALNVRSNPTELSGDQLNEKIESQLQKCSSKNFFKCPRYRLPASDADRNEEEKRPECVEEAKAIISSCKAEEIKSVSNNDLL